MNPIDKLYWFSIIPLISVGIIFGINDEVYFGLIIIWVVSFLLFVMIMNSISNEYDMRKLK